MLPQVTRRSFLPADATSGGDGAAPGSAPGLCFYSNSSANMGDTVDGEREEVKTKHERRDDHKPDIV